MSVVSNDALQTVSAAALKGMFGNGEVTEATPWPYKLSVFEYYNSLLIVMCNEAKVILQPIFLRLSSSQTDSLHSYSQLQWISVVIRFHSWKK